MFSDNDIKYLFSTESYQLRLECFLRLDLASLKEPAEIQRIFDLVLSEITFSQLMNLPRPFLSWLMQAKPQITNQDSPKALAFWSFINTFFRKYNQANTMVSVDISSSEYQLAKTFILSAQSYYYLATKNYLAAKACAEKVLIAGDVEIGSSLYFISSLVLLDTRDLPSLFGILEQCNKSPSFSFNITDVHKFLADALEFCTFLNLDALTECLFSLRASLESTFDHDNATYTAIISSNTQLLSQFPPRTPELAAKCLSIAALHGDVTAIRALIASGVVVTKESFPSLLNDAARGGNVEMIEFVINEFHFDVNAKNEIYPLEEALQHGHVAAVKRLIAAGAHFKSEDRHKRRAQSILHSLRYSYLSDKKTAEIFKLLFNKEELNKLVTRGKENIVFDEKNYQVEVDQPDPSCNETALFHSVENCHLKATKVLLEHGANLLFSNNLERKNPLLIGAIIQLDYSNKNQKQQAEMVKYLLNLKNKGGKRLLHVNQTDYQNKTALHHAIELKLFGIVKILVDANADFSKIYVDGKHLIQHAYINSLPELFLTICEKDFSLSRGNEKHYFADPLFIKFHIKLIEDFFSHALSFTTDAKTIGCFWDVEYLADQLKEPVRSKYLALKKLYEVRSKADINEIEQLLIACGGDYPLWDETEMLFNCIFETISSKFSLDKIDDLITHLIEKNQFDFRGKIPLINLLVLGKHCQSKHAALYNAFTILFDEGNQRLLTQLFQGFYNDYETIELAEEAHCYDNEPASVQLSMSSLANLFKNEIHGLCVTQQVDPIGVPDWLIEDLQNLIKVEQQATTNEVPKNQYFITKKQPEAFLWLLHNIQLLRAQIVQKNTKFKIQLPCQPFVRDRYIKEPTRSSILAPDSPLCSTQQKIKSDEFYDALTQCSPS